MLKEITTSLLILVPTVVTGQDYPRLNVADLPAACPDDKEGCIEAWRSRFESRAVMGFSILPVEQPEQGQTAGSFRVVGVTPGSAADKNGFRVGDVITAWGDHKITSDTADLFLQTHRELKAGTKIAYTLNREGEVRMSTLTAEPPQAKAVEAKLQSILDYIYGPGTWVEYLMEKESPMEKETD